MADQDPYAATAIKPAAKKAQAAASGGDPYAATAVQAAPAAAPTSDFTTNSVNPATGSGYGTYRMAPPGNSQRAGEGTEVSIPFNRVAAAQAAGYQLHPDEAPRYQKDSTHVGQGPTSYERVASLLTRMTAPMPDTPLTGSPINQGAAALSNVGKLPFNVANRAMRGVAGLPQGMMRAVVDAYHGNPEGFDPFAMGESAQHNLSEDTAGLGPMAAIGNLGGDAVTMYAAGKAGPRIVEVAADPMMKVVRSVRNAPESFARAATGTGDAPIEELVKNRQEANEKIDAVNQDRTEAQRTKQADTDTDYRGNLLKLKQKYEQDVRSATEKARNGTAADRAQVQAKNLASKQKYEQAVRDAQAKHAESTTTAQKAQEGNTAAENTLALRRKHEQALQQATDRYYAKEAAADTRAKAKENSAWSNWRQKTAGATIDGGQIADQLKSIAAISPETSRLLRQLQSAPEDALPDSMYAQDRAAIMKSQGYTGGYFDYPEPVRAQIDRIATSSGFEPDPIDFDPQAGKPIPVEQVHRAASILQRYIRSGRFEGPLLGEMKQTAKVLRNAVTRASADAGAAADLNAARGSTIAYQEAFGREPHPPSTARTVREKQVNPEAFRGRADEERLAAARRFDPTLVNSYRRVKAARGALKQLPAEDQLRKGLQQVTPPRGANLPLPPVLENAPAPRASNLPLPPVIPEPKTVPLELRPYETISSPDIVGARRGAAEARANKVWNRGQWAATWPIFQAARALWGGHIPSIPMMGLESAGMLATVKATTGLLRYPPMIRFLEQARPEDIPLIPPELRGDLPGLVSQAQQQGIKVSPALSAAASVGSATAAGQQQQQQSSQTASSVMQALQAMQPPQPTTSTLSQGAPQ